MLSPGSFGKSQFMPSKISKDHLGQTYRKGKGRQKGKESMQDVHVGERGETISRALKKDKREIKSEDVATKHTVHPTSNKHE